jgi:predicted anti-sigma-YlaC factor YlaD
MEEGPKSSRRHACPRLDIRKQLLLYLNGDVTKREKRRIERHLGACTECRDFLRLFRLMKRLVKRGTI